MSLTKGPNSPLFAFLFIGFMVAAVTWWIGTEAGRQIVRSSIEEARNQQNTTEDGSTNSSPKQVCPHCGWQNPTQNNYCHDCGSRLDAEESDGEGSKIDDVKESYKEGEIDESEFERKVEAVLESDDG